MMNATRETQEYLYQTGFSLKKKSHTEVWSKGEKIH